MDDRRIRRAQSCAGEARQAVQELHSALARPDLELVVFFCSSEYDLDALAAEMRHLFAGIHVVGCTTAGEIGPTGCRKHSLSGIGFPAGSGIAVSGRLHTLSRSDLAGGNELAQDLLQRLEGRAPQASSDNCFALMLIDGMSGREEAVAHMFQQALGRTVLCGGSAGDDRRFCNTYVYADGAFHADSAILLLMHTALPFRAFMTQHFVAAEERAVVTKADAARRIVMEINGRPAAEEYARLAGVDLHALNSRHFAASPIVIKVAGTNYVRSILRANPDGSLTFYCAIDNGMVLRVGRGVDMLENLEQTYEVIKAEIGSLQIVLGVDCMLRNLEVSQNGLYERVEELFRATNTSGFNSYGEQFRGVHVNQTFTGIAIGNAVSSTMEPPDD